jgi:hypothetical protein
MNEPPHYIATGGAQAWANHLAKQPSPLKLVGFPATRMNRKTVIYPFGCLSYLAEMAPWHHLEHRRTFTEEEAR